MQRELWSSLCMGALLIAGPAAYSQQTKESHPPLGTASFTPPQSKQHEPLTPENFVVRAAIANLAEISASELALEKSADASIRDFAKRLITDHRQAQAKLRAVGAEGKVALPGTVDEEHRKQQQKLSELVGAEFDRTYLEQMYAGHEQALQLFQDATHADLPASHQRYAAQTSAIVHSHLTALEELRSRTKR